MEFLSFDTLIANESESLDVRQRRRLLYMESASWYSDLIDHQSKDANSAIAYINDALNDQSRRWNGLQLLSVIVHKASHTNIFENYRGWIQHLKKFILHDVKLNVRLLAIKILGKIAYHCQTDHEHSRYLASNVVPSMVPSLLELDNKWSLVVVHGLYYFLLYFPGSSRAFMPGIQRRLLEALCSDVTEVVELSSLCISRIPFAGAVTERGQSQSCPWSDLFQKLLQTLHSFLNFMYKDFELETQVHIDLSEQIPLPLTLDNPDDAAFYVDSYSRFTSICLCVEQMLKNGDAVSLPIPIEKVLLVVGRILKVNGKSLMDNELAAHKSLLFTTLPMLHSHALRILDALIICCRKHLLLHDRRILNLLLQSLSWPSALWKTEKYKCPLSKLTISTYGVLISWFQVMGSSTDIAMLSDSFLKRMISDAFHGQSSVDENKLVAAEVDKPITKKRKVEQYLLSSSVNYSRDMVDEELCCVALKALKILLYNYSEDLKSSALKDLFTRVTNILFKIQRSSAELMSNAQFSNARCRKALYKLLLAMISSHSFLTSDVVSRTIRIFSNGCSDRQPQVAQLCFQAKMHCHALIEPVRRYLPVKASAIQKLVDDQSATEIIQQDSLPNVMKNSVEPINKDNVDAANKPDLGVNRVLPLPEENIHLTSETERMELESGQVECNSPGTGEKDILDSPNENLVDLGSPDSVIEINENGLEDKQKLNGVELESRLIKCRIATCVDPVPPDIQSMLSSFVAADPD